MCYFSFKRHVISSPSYVAYIITILVSDGGETYLQYTVVVLLLIYILLHTNKEYYYYYYVIQMLPVHFSYLFSTNHSNHFINHVPRIETRKIHFIINITIEYSFLLQSTQSQNIKNFINISGTCFYIVSTNNLDLTLHEHTRVYI